MDDDDDDDDDYDDDDDDDDNDGDGGGGGPSEVPPSQCWLMRDPCPMIATASADA